MIVVDIMCYFDAVAVGKTEDGLRSGGQVLDA